MSLREQRIREKEMERLKVEQERKRVNAENEKKLQLAREQKRRSEVILFSYCCEEHL